MISLELLEYGLSAKSWTFRIALSGAIKVDLRRVIRPSQESQPNHRRPLL